jgi:hypothetical protein
MLANIFRASGIVFVLALGVGCGAKGSALTQGEFCTRKATKECAAVAARCLAPTSSCMSARVDACTAFANANMNATTRPFQPDKADACLNKTAEIYAKPTITPVDREAMNDLCARVFSALKKDGDPCAGNFDCDNAASICDTTFMVCARKNTVAVDAFCGNPGEVCAAGQYCTGSPRKCAARIAQGQACGADMPCLESFRCVTGASPTCEAKVPLLESCTGDSDCLSVGTDAAPYCDTFFGNICTKGFTPSGGSPECVNAFGGMPIGGGGDASAG